MKLSLFLRLAVAASLATSVAACGADDEDDDSVTDTDAGNTETGGNDTGEEDATTDTGATDTGSDVATDVPEADVPEADVPEADVPEADVPAASPTLDAVHSAVFAVSCAGAGCHIGAFPGAGLNLANDAGLLDRMLADSQQSDLPLIEPGNADNSYLYLKCTGEHTLAGGSGTAMPQARPALTAENLKLLADYINITLAP